MPATIDRPAPTVEAVEIDRIREGEPDVEELGVQYRAAHGSVRATLIILSRWHKRTATYRCADFYHVETLDSPMGRAFRLWREKRKVEKDPRHDPSYWVLVNGQGGQCDCMGGIATARYGRVCKHLAVMGRLVEAKAV